MIIDYIRKVEYVPFTCRYLSNIRFHHEVHEATGNDIMPNVLQEYHVVTRWKNIQSTFNTIFNVRLIKLKRQVMKEEVEDIIKYLIEK